MAGEQLNEFGESKKNALPVACFAPPLTDELIAEYERLAHDAESEVCDAMRQCLAGIKIWWDLPESTKTGDAFEMLHTGRNQVIKLNVKPLEDEHKAALDVHIPYWRELVAMQPLFDRIKEKKLRDAAHHLLWYAMELCRDREPLSSDVLPVS